MKLGEFFDLRELSKTSSALPNVPPPDAIENMRALVSMQLDRARRRLGSPLFVTSGYRSPAVNARAGGSPTSAHMDGRAADVYSLKVDVLKLAAIFASFGEFDQIIAYHPSCSSSGRGWVHVGIAEKEKRPREQLLYRWPAKVEGYPAWGLGSPPW